MLLHSPNRIEDPSKKLLFNNTFTGILLVVQALCTRGRALVHPFKLQKVVLKRRYKFLLLGTAIVATPYLLKSLCAGWSTQGIEATELLPGDGIVLEPKVEYTLALSISSSPSAIWPWFVQMGGGRAGFYTYEWIENLLGADIHNANEILPLFQDLKVGDKVWLTPDPCLGGVPGQFLVVD